MSDMWRSKVNGICSYKRILPHIFKLNTRVNMNLFFICVCSIMTKTLGLYERSTLQY